MMSAPTPLGTSGRDPAQFQLARDAVLPALCQAFGAALARFDDALFDRAGNAGASQLLFLDAMRELRRRREEIAAAFAGHLQRAWAALVAGEPLSADATLSGPAEDGLSLLAEHVLESRLAVRNFATVLLRDFKPVLARLDRRLGWLAGDVPLDADLNPISPEHLGVAIHEAFAGCELAPEVHLVLIKLCERDLRAPVGRIYDKLDEQLAAAGVMSQMGAVRRTPAAPGPRPPQGLDDLVEQRPVPGFDSDFSDDEQAAPAWAQRFAARWSERRGHLQQAGGDGPGAAGSEAYGQQGMLLEALQELLQQTRHVREDATSAAQVAVGQQRPLSQREMMSVLSLLQATPSATLRAAIGEDGESLAQRLKSEVLSSATRLGVDPGQTRLDPQDEDAIDLVGMLFDVMLDERELEGRSRELIGRLVVPFVKVAMLDRRMFVQKTHPARKLLNSLAEACEGNTGESQAERMLMAKVEEIIERLVAEFNENLAIFLTLEEEFRDFLVQHRRRVEIAERRAAETQRGQEKLEMARTRAATELDRRIGDATLPPAIAEFLRQPWQHHLTLALLREGEDGASVAEALALGDGLLEEVAEARRQIIGKPWLQAWQPVLAKVFASVGVHGDAATSAIDALHDTLQGIAESRPELERALPELPQVVLPMPPVADSPTVELGSQVDTDDFDNADADRFRRMEIGSWLDFVDKDGKVQAGKLSWVSPISSRLLFVNRRGVRFCVASPEELAVMVRLGRLRAHVDDGAFDSAMQGVIDRLDPGNATLH
ncbi:DUF1631 domain-containing protein [Stenotrophomonas sp. TWI169]|uniref:DUF1631 domain-containing protein n=1 Tax=Stenotrophomonas TaxID=40323 RepID=UPI0010099C77|nr:MULTISPECIES: DUF1631 domain-containing protein [Stenotrophomonas]MDH0173409.1 DUF1631 domain-containing protein [Stenotrophomonas sp. GD04145]MDH2024788.1 DUF1631 domain-containing protein [Stenotrophomonas sp. GD03680]MDI9249361.1 DUF1631 domain-containing protein [Stenotrophomonas sp. RS-48]RXK67473.1 DUF1631 domain-containing protein [Stenotrophomonas sp. MA5]HDS1559683.1 DUF1631 domain-containing protein [Stenotrophomonas maltophilia]